MHARKTKPPPVSSSPRTLLWKGPGQAAREEIMPMEEPDVMNMPEIMEDDATRPLTAGDVLALMGHLGILPGGEENREQQEIVETDYVESDADGFWYPLVAKNQVVCMGEVLGRLESLTGKLIQEVRAKFDGVVLYHTIALGVHEGEALIAYGHT